MLFTSYSFLFAFLPLVLAAFFACPVRFRCYVILFASYLFYALWRVDFCLLLVGVSVVGYIGGRYISSASRRGDWVFFISISVLLGVLAWFKYLGFFVESIDRVISWFGLNYEPGRFDVLLPVGISFFTFQTVSYIVDVKRGMRPADSALEFFSYVALFPQLIAGPIVRFSEVSTQIRFPQPTLAQVDAGVVLFMMGFCKKVWIANNFAPIADWAFSLQSPELLIAWLGLLSYTFQIYFDFSGYTDMAIGLGLVFGFSFPENFNAPYRATSITEFWQRWHITMSRFFRDYLYIPLGGNRLGKLRTFFNLFATMALAGLWHGAGWTFIAWGIWHGALLIVHRIWSQITAQILWRNSKFFGFLSGGVTLMCVMLGWVFFRADSFAGVMIFLSGLVGLNGVDYGTLLDGRIDLVLILCSIAALVFLFVERRSWNRLGTQAVGKIILIALFIGALHELGSQEANPFLYFQF